MNYPLEGLIQVFAALHRYDEDRLCCTCGFCAWSPTHVAVMAYREAADELRARSTT